MKRVVLCTSGNHPVFKALLQSRHRVSAFIDFGKPEHRLSKSRALYNRFHEGVLGQPRTAAAICRLHDIPYIHVRGRELDQASQLVRNIEADIMVVAQAPVLPASFFSLLPDQAINLHPSKLPAYRGADPFFWMAVDQVREAAATVHLLMEKVDQGDILAQNARPIDLGLTEKQLARIAIEELGAPLVVEVLDDFAALKQNARPQTCANKKPSTRNVSPKTFHDIIDLASLSLDQAWNVLRFIQDWPAVIKANTGPNKLYRLEVLGHDRLVRKRNQLDEGAKMTEKRQGRCYYCHPEGDIEIRTRMNLGGFIRSMA